MNWGAYNVRKYYENGDTKNYKWVKMFVSEWFKAAKADDKMIEQVCRKYITSKIQANLGMQAYLKDCIIVFNLFAPVSFAFD